MFAHLHVSMFHWIKHSKEYPKNVDFSWTPFSKFPIPGFQKDCQGIPDKMWWVKYKQILGENPSRILHIDKRLFFNSAPLQIRYFIYFKFMDQHEFGWMLWASIWSAHFFWTFLPAPHMQHRSFKPIPASHRRINVSRSVWRRFRIRRTLQLPPHRPAGSQAHPQHRLSRSQLPKLVLPKAMKMKRTMKRNLRQPMLVQMCRGGTWSQVRLQRITGSGVSARRSLVAVATCRMTSICNGWRGVWNARDFVTSWSSATGRRSGLR